MQFQLFPEQLISCITGSSVTYIVLMILPDDIPELNEEMTLTLTSVDPAGTQRLRAGFTRKSVVIGQNDNPGGVFQFEASEPLTYSIAVSLILH